MRGDGGNGIMRNCSQTNPKIDQVGTICYRFNKDKLEFLLVRTSDRRWIFPKGNIEKNESLWRAAEREAFEEGGVSGEIETEPITNFLHLKKGLKQERIELNVAAFLLHVKSCRKPLENHREPTWFDPTGAEKALSEDRSFKYSEEFKRVIRLACGRINE